MNKLRTLLEIEPSQTQEQFEKSFRKVFGIPAEIQDPEPQSIIFKTYEEKFSIDWEGNLLWYLNNTWEPVATLEEARHLWKTKKK
jgi:hypothetical protein